MGNSRALAKISECGNKRKKTARCQQHNRRVCDLATRGGASSSVTTGRLGVGYVLALLWATDPMTCSSRSDVDRYAEHYSMSGKPFSMRVRPSAVSPYGSSRVSFFMLSCGWGLVKVTPTAYRSNPRNKRVSSCTMHFSCYMTHRQLYFWLKRHQKSCLLGREQLLLSYGSVTGQLACPGRGRPLRILNLHLRSKCSRGFGSVL